MIGWQSRRWEGKDLPLFTPRQFWLRRGKAKWDSWGFALEQMPPKAGGTPPPPPLAAAQGLLEAEPRVGHSAWGLCSAPSLTSPYCLPSPTAAITACVIMFGTDVSAAVHVEQVLKDFFLFFFFSFLTHPIGLITILHRCRGTARWGPLRPPPRTKLPALTSIP